MQDPYRDYIAEMRAIIDEKTKAEEYVASMVAKEIVETLRLADPELLIGWLELNAASMLRNTITSIDRSRRAYAHLIAKPNAFASAAEAAAEGDDTPIKSFLDMRYVVDTADTRKRLGDMDARDLKFVADDYASQAKRAAMHAAFMRKLADKVGNDKVSDHYTDRQLTKMWTSLGLMQ